MRIAMAGPTGGAGRTTLTLNLAVTLSERGLRVIMIDLDPQGGMGFHLARKDDEWAGIADLLMGRVTLDQVVKRSNRPLLSLMPRGRLSPGDVGEFERAVQRPDVLGAALRNLESSFDIILLDLPAGTGSIVRGAFAAATDVVVVVAAETPSVRAMPRVLKLVDLVRDGGNSELNLLAVVPNKVVPESMMALDVLSGIVPRGATSKSLCMPNSELFALAHLQGRPALPSNSADLPEMKAVRILANRVESHLNSDSDAPVDGSVAPADGPTRYLGFNSSRFDEKGELSLHEKLSDGSILELDTERLEGLGGLDEWKGFLDLCLGATESETAFVTDEQGLSIASRGRLHGGKIEGLGTRLMAALLQARSMDIAAGEVKSVILEFDHLWMTGFEGETASGRKYSIGVLGREPVGPAARKEIREAFKSLEKMNSPREAQLTDNL